MSDDLNDAGGRTAPTAGEAAGWHPEAAAAQADALLDRRRIAPARQLLAQALREAPRHPALLFGLARAELLEDRHDAAREVLGQLLAVAPRHVGGRLLLFVAEMESNRLPQAELLILELLRESPQQAEFYAHYARLMLRGLNFDKASQLADEGLRLAPQSDTCLRARALCDLVVQRQPEPGAALNRLLAGDPHDLHTLRLVVIALVQAGRSREAHALARTLLRAQPDDPDLLGLVKALRMDTHWSLIPLRPLQRWGWGGSIALWVIALVGMQLVRRFAPEWSGPASVLLLGYVAYSWIWPPLLRRWMARD